MKKSDDIAKLFEYLGESLNDGYQEIVAQSRGDAAQIRWPVLGGASVQRQEEQQTVVYEANVARPKPEFFIKLDEPPVVTPAPESTTAAAQSLGLLREIVVGADDPAAKKVNDLRAFFRRLESSQEQRPATGRMEELVPHKQLSQTLSLFQRLLGA